MMLLFLLCTILHFDLNQTIIVADEAGGKSIENVIAHNLAKEEIDTWDDSAEKMSYFDYIYYHKFDVPHSDRTVKKKKLKLLSNFPQYLREISHPSAKKVCERYVTLCQKAHGVEGLIIPAFYRAIDNMENGDTVVLRTFGGDLFNAVDEIEKNSKIRFAYRGTFLGHELHLTDGRVLKTAQEITTLFRSGHGAVQDNYHYWNTNNERAAFGKIFPYDGNSLFFDDHAPYIVAPVASETGEKLDLNELIHAGKVIRANILKAIEDDAYYERWHRHHRALLTTQ